MPKPTLEVTVYYTVCRIYQVAADERQEAVERASKRAKNAGLDITGTCRVEQRE